MDVMVDRKVKPAAQPTQVREVDQEAVIRQFLPIIKALARRMATRRLEGLDASDLVSAGLMGLMDAVIAERFVPGWLRMTAGSGADAGTPTRTRPRCGDCPRRTVRHSPSSSAKFQGLLSARTRTPRGGLDA